MSGGDDGLIGALARAGVEAAKLVRRSAEEAASELSGALGADQLKIPAGLLGRGPIIPGPYKRPDQGIAWQDGYMASCECQQLVPRLPVTPGCPRLACFRCHRGMQSRHPINAREGRHQTLLSLSAARALPLQARCLSPGRCSSTTCSP